MWFREIAAVEDPGRDELEAFVDGILKFLSFVLERRQDFGFLWVEAPELRDLAIETFQRDVTESAAELRAIIPEISTQTLVRHGLLGRPVRFKFQVLNMVANGWERVQVQRPLIRWWLNRTMKAIDEILESLGLAAGGFGGVLKEFKGTMEVLSDAEET